MSGSIPSDAFEHYLSMGSDRSFTRLAEKYGVSKQAVVKRASKERWRERLDEIEAKARRETDRKAAESIEAMNARLLKQWALVESRAVQALGVHQIASGMDAARALDLATKNIRLIRGEPTDRQETIAQIVRRESERFLTTAETDDWTRFETNGSDDDDAGAGDAEPAQAAG